MNERIQLGRAVPIGMLVLAVAAAAGAATFVGQVATPDLQVEGVNAPSGTVLMSPSLVATRIQPGLLHLADGRSLVLAPKTEVALEAAGGKSVQVEVVRGAAAYRDASGKIVRLASMAPVPLGPQEEVIGEGRRVTGLVAVVTATAAAGTSALSVDSTSRIDAGQKVLVRTPDGAVQGVYCIDSVDAGALLVTLRGALTSGFPPGAQLIQGSEVQKALDDGKAQDHCPAPPPPPGTVSRDAGLIVAGFAAGAVLNKILDEEEVSPRLP